MRKRGVYRVAWLAVIPLLFLAVAACSDDDTPSVEDVATAVNGAGGAESEVCEKLDDLGTAVSQVENLNASSTVDEAKEARQEVQEAADDVKEAASGLGSAQLNALETARDSLRGTIDNLPQDQPVGQAVATIVAQARGLTAALSGMESERGCP
jgi:hypothetical protein